MGKFKENEIVNFLELYKRHECLWRCSHRYYREQSVRDAAYSHIKDAMNLSSILEVKQKIKSFRDTYASERAKMRKSAMTATHPSEIFQTKLRWYYLADSFLNNPDGREGADFPMIPEHTVDNSAFVSPNVAMQTTADYSGTTAHTQTHSMYRPTRVKRNHLKQLQRRVDPMERDTQQKDEFYHFGMNVAMQLRSLPLVNALDLQTKFQQMLGEVRIAWEQSRYEDERCESSSVSLVDENPLSFHESIPFLRSPKEVVDVKAEYSIEEISESTPSGGF